MAGVTVSRISLFTGAQDMAVPLSAVSCRAATSVVSFTQVRMGSCTNAYAVTLTHTLLLELCRVTRVPLVLDTQIAVE